MLGSRSHVSPIGSPPEEGERERERGGAKGMNIASVRKEQKKWVLIQMLSFLSSWSYVSVVIHFVVISFFSNLIAGPCFLLLLCACARGLVRGRGSVAVAAERRDFRIIIMVDQSNQSIFPRLLFPFSPSLPTATTPPLTTRTPLELGFLGVLRDLVLPLEPFGRVDGVDVEVHLVHGGESSTSGVDTHGVSVSLVDGGVLHVGSSPLQLGGPHGVPPVESTLEANDVGVALAVQEHEALDGPLRSSAAHDEQLALLVRELGLDLVQKVLVCALLHDELRWRPAQVPLPRGVDERNVNSVRDLAVVVELGLGPHVKKRVATLGIQHLSR